VTVIALVKVDVPWQKMPQITHDQSLKKKKYPYFKVSKFPNNAV